MLSKKIRKTRRRIKKLNKQNKLYNKLVNNKKTKSKKITLHKLGVSRKRKYKKIKGGDNIGANCNDPNFSIYNTNLLKLFPYKGGEISDDIKLDINDIYKNNTADFY